MAHLKELPPALDHDIVAALRERKHPEAGTLFAHLTSIFQQETPTILDAIERAWQENQAGDLEDYAHTLKGNAAVVGAKRLHLLCAEIVDACREGFVPRPITINSLRPAYEAFLDAL